MKLKLGYLVFGFLFLTHQIWAQTPNRDPSQNLPKPFWIWTPNFGKPTIPAIWKILKPLSRMMWSSTMTKEGLPLPYLV